jgi:hypothetical protein
MELLPWMLCLSSLGSDMCRPCQIPVRADLYSLTVKRVLKTGNMDIACQEQDEPNICLFTQCWRKLERIFLNTGMSNSWQFILLKHQLPNKVSIFGDHLRVLHKMEILHSTPSTESDFLEFEPRNTHVVKSSHMKPDVGIQVVISAPWGLRPKDHEWEYSLGYLVKPCLKTTTTKCSYVLTFF